MPTARRCWPPPPTTPGRAALRTWRGLLTQPMEGAVFVETIPFEETRNYVRNVMSNATNYAALFESVRSRSRRAWGRSHRAARRKACPIGYHDGPSLGVQHAQLSVVVFGGTGFHRQPPGGATGRARGQHRRAERRHEAHAMHLMPAWASTVVEADIHDDATLRRLVAGAMPPSTWSASCIRAAARPTVPNSARPRRAAAPHRRRLRGRGRAALPAHERAGRGATARRCTSARKRTANWPPSARPGSRPRSSAPRWCSAGRQFPEHVCAPAAPSCPWCRWPAPVRASSRCTWATSPTPSCTRCATQAAAAGLRAGRPGIYTLAELVRLAGRYAGHPRPVLPCPMGWRGCRRPSSSCCRATPLISRDNLDSMKVDNVVDRPSRS
jgi:hypothetical protein